MIAGGLVRVSLVVLQTLMGLAAVASGPALVVTNGLGMPPEWMEGSPFGSYIVPGLVLLAVGVVNMAGALAALRRHRWGGPLSATVGLLWVGWFAVQVTVVGLVSWQQPVYFLVGLLILALATPSLIERHRAREVLHGRPGAP